MFRRSGGAGGRGKTSTVPVNTSTGNEVPVEGVVRVTKVDRIQAYNLVSRPSSVHHAVSPATSVPVESLAVSVVSMFRRSGGGATPVPVSTSTGNELPVEGVVRVKKVDRIQAYNLVSRPSVYHAISPATSVPVENLAVSVVRVGDVVDDEHDGFVSVSVS
uniref:Uncharacterized protein n=1 Tax=Avena sativa TaxID=4498 RepID=A0ACD5W3M2_AVESA